MTQSPQSILVVEDDDRLAHMMATSLNKAGYEAQVETNGTAAVERIRRDCPDLVVLDIMLPGADGFTVCKKVREFYNNPILMVTALGSDEEHIQGLEAGADGYLIKPVRLPILQARVQNLLKRLQPSESAKEQSIDFGPLHVDPKRRSVTLGDNPIKISTGEFDLLWLLASHEGIVMSRDDLCRALRGIDYDGIDRSIDMRVSKLRQKLKNYPEIPVIIKTIHGHGYLFVSPEADAA